MKNGSVVAIREQDQAGAGDATPAGAATSREDSAPGAGAGAPEPGYRSVGKKNQV